MTFMAGHINTHGVTNQLKVEASRVLVIGAGGIGCPLLLSLVHSGFKNISIVDPDIIDQSNLSRQTLYTHLDTGLLKADKAKKVLSNRFPGLSIEAYNQSFEANHIGDIDLVIDGTDSFECKLKSSKVAKERGIDCIVASIYRSNAQIFHFFNSTNPPISLGDVFPSQKEQKSCSLLGVYGTHCAVVGAKVAQDAILRITNRLNVSQFYEFCSQSMKSSAVKLTGLTERNTDRPQVESAPLIALDVAISRGLKVVDVRDHEEFSESPSNCNNIPWTDFFPRPTVGVENGTVFICKSGSRAKTVANHLKAAGVVEECYYAI